MSSSARAKVLCFLTSKLFAPETTRWVSSLRIGVAVTLLIYAITLRVELPMFHSFGPAGLSGRELSEVVARFESPVIPILDWVLTPAQRLGLSAATTINLLWLTLLLSDLALLFGFFSRPAAIACWLLHLMFAKSGALFAYGVENFITIGLFYLMLAPLPDELSFDRLVRTRVPPPSPALSGFFRHALQLHLCFIYFFGGLTKAIGSGWWNGLSLWRALTRPPFNIIPPAVIADARPLLPVLGIAVWVIELAFPIFIWPKQTRALWLGLIISLHVGIALAMGMYLFACVAIVLNVAGFYSFSSEKVSCA
jgi:hypothetical protein